jgi:hypothetical protein
MRTSGVRDASIPIELKFSVDALSGVMLLVVTGGIGGCQPRGRAAPRLAGRWRG